MTEQENQQYQYHQYQQYHQVVPRVQTNFIKTAQIADTPHKWHRSIENITSMCRGTGAVTVAATDSGKAQMYSPAVNINNGSSGYF